MVVMSFFFYKKKNNNKELALYHAQISLDIEEDLVLP